MKAYKGLKRNKDGTLECRGFIYEPNKKYTFDGEIELCKQGFHACRELSDVWAYYPNNGNNVYYEVECGGEMKEHDGNSKFVCSEITLLKEVDTSDVVKFNDAWSFSEGYAKVYLKGKGWNFINRNGELIGNQWYDDAWSFSEGYAWVELKGKGWNFINRNGELIGNQWYDYAWDFSEGYAWVKLNGKGWNYINRNGELIGNQWYDDAWSFREGYATVELDCKWYKLRKDGVLCDRNTKQPIEEMNV